MKWCSPATPTKHSPFSRTLTSTNAGHSTPSATSAMSPSWHKDLPAFMPKSRRCWASWVYHAEDSTLDRPAVSLTYWMNSLQGIEEKYPLFVTLNPSRTIAPEHVFDRHVFMHPVFDFGAFEAQAALRSMQGRRNTWFCGAHLGHGFHEDGLTSAIRVAESARCTAALATAIAKILRHRTDQGRQILRRGRGHAGRGRAPAERRMIRLLDARVFHARLRPRKNQFRYGALYLVLNVDVLSQPERLGLFSVDRANFFGIRSADYGDGLAPPAKWIRKNPRRLEC